MTSFFFLGGVSCAGISTTSFYVLVLRGLIRGCWLLTNMRASLESVDLICGIVCIARSILNFLGLFLTEW